MVMTVRMIIIIIILTINTIFDIFNIIFSLHDDRYHKQSHYINMFITIIVYIYVYIYCCCFFKILLIICMNILLL